MQSKTESNIERIIAKIDNDFNPDNSDWIPRVGTWVYDAMQILRITKYETVKKTIKVKDKIAYSNCYINGDDLKVYTKQGCIVREINESVQGCSCGEKEDNSFTSTGRELQSGRNYVLIGKDKIELNFDTDCIIVETSNLKTKYSKHYGCNLPIVPNNGVVIEAIVSYCMYKMLCRGYKHPVMQLRVNNPATNPYVLWNYLINKVKTESIIDAQGDVVDDGGIWRDNFYIYTFNPNR